MVWLLAASIGFNVLLFVKGFRLFNQCDNLHDLLDEEAKNNVILQSKLDKYDEIFRLCYGDESKPTIIIDEDWE